MVSQICVTITAIVIDTPLMGLFQSSVIIVFSYMITIFIPDRTFLVRFDGISGEFSRTIVCILARLQNTHGGTKRGWYAAEA